jgi:hypothetical protein
MKNDNEIDYKIFTITMTVAIPTYGLCETHSDASLFVHLDEEAFMLGYDQIEREIR